MYGIPDFKLEKSKVWRRIDQMKAEGVEFRTNANIGVNVPVAQLQAEYDALLLTGGATQPRDLPIPGRELKGVYFAMEFLPQQNKVNQGDVLDNQILATGKHVIVIGGGDTGSDCTGTSNRHGCASLTQFELFPTPPDVGRFPRAHERPANSPWPNWPMIMRTSTSHEEGCDRQFSILTKEFLGDDNGHVRGLRTAQIEWTTDEAGRQIFKEVPGSEKDWPTQLVLLAMGFLGPEKNGLLDSLGVKIDARGNVECNEEYQTSVPNVFAAGDMRRGQSLVVWAIHEGREAARAVDRHLMGLSHLPSVNAGDFAWR
jgi:glutamate synthase (NADPH/NADH) small chain